MTFVPNRNLINKQLADQSHAHTSWDPEKRSAQEIQGFVDHIQNVYDSMQKYAKTDAQKELLDAEMQRYQSGYAIKYNADLAAKGRTFSSMITGGSGFNVRAHEKANKAEQNRYDDMKEWDDRAQTAILRELKKHSIEEAGGELEVMKKKIADAEEAQENYKKINVILRKKNLSDDAKVQEIIAATGYKESTARNMFNKDFAGRTGIPSYVLTNNNANIRRMQERLKEMEKKEATPTTDIDFAGGTIIDNAEVNRIQIFFDKIPPDEIRTKLKGSGWKWSPNAGAWQRMRTEASRYSAKQITGAMEKKVAEEVKEIKKELAHGETIDVPAIDIPGLMKKGTLPDPDWEFEKQEDERIKREQEREVNPDDYYKDAVTESDWGQDPDEIRSWMDFEVYKEEMNKGETITVPQIDLKAELKPAKELWEMTYQEFATEFQDKYNDSGFGFAERIGKPLGIESQAGEPLKIINGKKRGYPQSLIRDRWRYVILQDAINRGNKLSTENMSDYLENQKNFPILLEGSAKPIIVEAKEEILKGETVVIPESTLIAGTRPTGKIKRFENTKEYIGITYRNKSTFMDWQENMSLKKFRGRPYSTYDYDSIIEYTPDKWSQLIELISTEASENNRDVREDKLNNAVFQAPRIISTPKSQKVSAIHEVKKEIAQGATVEVPETSLKTQIPIEEIKTEKMVEDYQKELEQFYEEDGRCKLKSGIFKGKTTKRCPDCFRGLEKGVCGEHGRIQPEDQLDLRNIGKDPKTTKIAREEYGDFMVQAKEAGYQTFAEYYKAMPDEPISFKQYALLGIGLEKIFTLNKGATIEVPESTLKTDLKPMKNVVATYRNLAWDAKEKGNYKQAAEFYEIAINNYELHPVEGELYKSDLANLKKLHAEAISLSKISKGETAVLPESSLKTMTVTQVPTAEAKWRKFEDHKSETKTVKEALRDAGIEAEVGHGKGTAWGWLEINIGDPRTRKGLKPPPLEYQYNEEEQALHNKVLKIARDVTGRHGEYGGNINLMAQDWRNKTKKVPASAPVSKPILKIFTHSTNSQGGEVKATRMALIKDGVQIDGLYTQDIDINPKINLILSRNNLIADNVIIEWKSPNVKNWLIKSKDGKFTLTKMYGTEKDVIEYATKKYPNGFRLDIAPKIEQHIPKVSDTELEKAREEGKRLRQDLEKGEIVKLPESKIVELKGQAGIPDKPPYGKEYPYHKFVRIIVETDKNGKKVYYQAIDLAWKKRIGIDTVNSLISEGRANISEGKEDSLKKEVAKGETLTVPESPLKPQIQGKYINEESLSYTPIQRLPVRIETEVAEGKTVEVPKSLLIKQLDSPPVPLSLYPSNPIQLLKKGETIELPGNKLDKMLQRTEKKPVKQPRKTEKQKHETVKTRQCTPPFHVHAYDVPRYTRKCPTNKGTKKKGKRV